MKPIIKSLYIHIPFCKQKCNYCDFVSYPGQENLIDDYVNALCREIKKQLTTYDLQLTTIYFGGGTPTLLAPKQFDKILNATFSNYALPITNYEISVEANPGTANKHKLRNLRSVGLNRLSIGVQSFNDQHLKTLGRIHDAKTALKFYEEARSAGFENINLDLIFGLPGQTFSDWQSDLNQALHLKPNHLSAYSLQIEKDTPLWAMMKSETRMRNELPKEEEELEMYEYTINTLTKSGFKHYEISNFARPGRECRHNIAYWQNENYLGIGVGAHSHVNGQRWANPDSLEAYIGSGGVWRNVGRLTDSVSQNATAQRETIFMGLRLLDGIPADKFIGYEEELAEQLEAGLLIKDNGRVKLSRQGLYLANEVFEKFV